jgi:hypothetical protein
MLTFIYFSIIYYCIYYCYADETLRRSLVSMEKDQKQQPLKVYIHVGPPKTGCTHFQRFIVVNLDKLPKVGYCYPATYIHNKSMSRLAMDLLRGNSNLTNHEREIERCLSERKNILISAENFASLDETKLFRLKSLFFRRDAASASHLPPVKIHILIAYREWLTRIYSHYLQDTKVNIYRAGPVSGFIYEGYGHASGSKDFDLVSMMERFDRVFNSSFVHIVDYQSILDLKKDIVHVYLCEVMGILCSITERLNKATTYENVRPLPQLIHLIAIVRDYVHFQGYKFLIAKDIDPTNNIGRLSRLILQNYTESNISTILPLKSSKLTLLHPYATQLDSQFREKYGERTLYGNKTASLKAMSNMQALEIDEKAFYRDDRWISWLKREFESLKAQKWIIKKVFKNKPVS